MIANKTILIIVLGLWILIVAIYLNNTPLETRSHDWDAHLQYTEIIVNQHHLPKPYEGYHTYHSPLYYLIISAILPPQFRTDPANHHRFARVLSVVFGVLTIVIMAWGIERLTKDKFVELLVLLFITTTPKFVITFSTYNNDSLSTLLCVLVMAICYQLYKNWSWKLAIKLLVVATASIYTKYTSVFCFAVIFLICCKNLLQQKFSGLIQIRIIVILLLSTVLFTPWMVFHNYQYTGKLVPTSFDSKINPQFNLGEINNTLSTVFKNPLSNQFPHEWDAPWAHPYERPETKQHDYPAFVFVTSVLSEFILQTPNINFIWTILWIHLFAYILGIREIFRSTITKLSAYFILLSHLIHIVNISRVTVPVFGCFMDFRYICWTWAAWAILYASAFSNKSEWSWILSRLLVIGIFIHIYILVNAAPLLNSS